MKHKFLTKNTKITINEVKPNGLKTAEKVYDEDGKINKKSLKDFSKKLSDYYNFDEDEFIEPKVDRTQDETEPWDVYDTEALGAGKMYGLKYDNEDTDVYDSFEERNDKLNDTSDYDDLFGTHDGFGETKDKNNTYERLKDSSKKYKEYKYDLPTEYQKTPRVRVTKGVNENKMKRLNFKTEFKSDADMVGLIPENYKKDGHTFLMSDGNQLYKVRWDTALNEGSILGYKNKSMIVESRNKMKKLYNYKYSDSMGKTNDYITEGDAMRKMMDMVKGKSSLNEQGDPFDQTTIDAELANKAASDKAASDKAASDKAAEPKSENSHIKKTYTIGGKSVEFKYPVKTTDGKNPEEISSPMIVRGPNGFIHIDKKTHKVIKGDLKKLFNFTVNSSPNGSMLTAYDDFIKYVNKGLPNADLQLVTNKSSASKGTIDNELTYVNQHRIVNKDQKKDFRIESTTANGKPHTWIVRVIYSDYVDGNGELKQKVVSNIRWIMPENTRTNKNRPKGTHHKPYWFDDTDLVSTDGKYSIPGTTVTMLGDKIGDEIWKPKPYHYPPSRRPTY